MHGMKTARIILATAVAALAFTACQKSDFVETSSKTFSFVAGETATKAAFGPMTDKVYPVSWTENDTQFGVVFNNGTSKVNADVVVSNGRAACEYTAPTGVETYQFNVVSPASALVGNSPTKGLNFGVPTSQTPTEGSVDEAALILYAVTDTYDAVPEETIKLEFNHFTAYGKVSIVGLDKEITAIDMTAESNWAGRWNYNTKTGEMLENSASKTISLTTTSLTDNWFACAPVDLGGKTIKFTVTAEDGIYEKTITIPTGKKFESGRIAKFSVDFTGVTPKEDVVFTLVTDVDDLTVDSQVIIVSLEKEFAMAGQTNNNRAQAAITKTENTIVNPSEAVDVFTLELGNIEGTGAFYSNGYLYAASSSSNYLRTSSTLDANASFSVAIAENGSASVKAQGTNTRNMMRYNSSSSCFSCYASGQGDIAIYKKNGTGSTTKIFQEITIPEFASLAELVEAEVADGTTVTVTVNDVIDSFYTSSSTGKRNGVYVMVGDQKVEIYCNDVPSTWVAGGTISGTVTCAWTLYKGTWELTPSSWSAFTYTAPTGGEGDDDDDDGGETTEGAYTLVTDAASLKDGDVIILGCKAKSAVGGPMGTGKFFTSVEAEFGDNTVTATGAIEITLGASEGVWTLTTSEGTIGTSAAKALVHDGTGATTWTIAIADGVATIASTTSTYGSIQYNASSPRFVNYTSAQTPIEIYKK